jgi:fructokinase
MCTAVSFGTLAQRSDTSRRTIHSFLAAAPQALRVLDVNLRQEYYSADILRQSCRAASMVKINDEELPIVSRLLGESSAGECLDHQAERLLEVFQLQALALTRGADGTVLYTGHGRSEGAPVSFPPAPRADNVGAGDACCAGLICGLVWGWPDDEVVQLANQLGAYVASQPGATPRFPTHLLESVRARQDRN